MNVIGTIKPCTPAVGEIERLNLAWHEDPNYDLELLNKDHRVQVRESDHYAPQERVDEYANQMAQTIFPPIVVTADHYLIDGATRQAAFAQRKQRFAPAFVVEVSFAAPQTTAKQRNTLYALGVTLNQMGGERLTKQEKRARIPVFLELGWKIDQIMRATGLGEGDIRRIKKERDVRVKFDRAGLPHDQLKAPKVLAFAGQDLEGMNNEPFKQLVQLSNDAGLRTAEINALARDVTATGSDDGAISFLAQQRAELFDRIKDVSLTGTFRTREPGQLRRCLGYINGFVGREQELVESNEEYFAAHIDAIAITTTVLTKVRDMQTVRYANAQRKEEPQEESSFWPGARS